MILTVTGIVVIAVGVLLVLAGLVMIWREYLDSLSLGPSAFVEKLAELLRALAGQPRSTVLFTFGVLLIFLGGLIAGVAGLAP